jgi:inorganic triphosphatase YgiF
MHQTHSLETELKLILGPDARQALQAHPLFHGADIQRFRQVTTYYDTPELLLSGAGLSLRVREQNGANRQTMKRSHAAAGAVTRRDEWEWPIETPSVDLDRLRETGLELPPLDGLRPVCTTDIMRQVTLLHPADQSLVEAAFGEGEVRANGASELIHELELEVKQGPAAMPYRLALQLSQRASLALDAESKIERGLRLFRGEPPAHCKAGRIHVDGDMSVGRAAHLMIGACLGHMLANLAAARAGQPEGVHQIRVAVRRLRAVLRLLRPVLEPHALAQFESALRREGQIFGEARDWDVAWLGTLPGAAGDAAVAPWLPLLLDAAEMRRSAAHAAVTADLAGRHFTDLVLALSAWAEDESADPMLPRWKQARSPISDCAPAFLEGLAKTVARRGRNVRHGDPGHLHGVRKSLKKLRYSVEFLRDLYRPRRVKAWLKPCKKLLEELGALNDAVALVRLVDGLATDTSPGLAPAVAAVALRVQQRREAAQARILPLWDAFRAVEPPWR